MSRESFPKARLIRFVLSPDGQVAPDLVCRLPGRGVYVEANRAVLQRAVEKSAFGRALKKKVYARADLPDLVEALLARRVVELMAMARKAGDAVCGFETVRDLLKAGRANLLVQASDGSTREKSQLRPPHGPESHVLSLSADELGMAFGRDRVIHAAVMASGLSDRIKQDALRLRGFRAQEDRQLFGDDAGARMAGEGPREKG